MNPTIPRIKKTTTLTIIIIITIVEIITNAAIDSLCSGHIIVSSEGEGKKKRWREECDDN